MLERTQQMEKEADSRLSAYRTVRQASLELCGHLETEDYGLQAMPDVSPPKWHLAHTTWFFETFLLKPFVDGYQAVHPQYEYLFNSYYNGIGQQYPRPQRGLLSRPTLAEVLAYREVVDQAMAELLAQSEHAQRDVIVQRYELGLNHEQQHQELLCTDIKYSFFQNPLFPALAPTPRSLSPSVSSAPMQLLTFDETEIMLGAQQDGFAFDNECPAHAVRLPSFQLAERLVNNAEYQSFIDAGGYENPALWLSDGWAWNREQQATQPLYWLQRDGEWLEYTAYGLQSLNPNLPVAHVNFYEADAYARWCGMRLPTEYEWEAACRQQQIQPRHDVVQFHPSMMKQGQPFDDLFGSVWQWTRSSYAPYPGFRADDGAIGEYNGKFMCNQMVLRGSSCVTPQCHARPSYRNFFYPKDQWQFSGIRLAADAAD